MARRLAFTLVPLVLLSALGLNGVTAYFGLIDVGRPVAGETVARSRRGPRRTARRTPRGRRQLPRHPRRAPRRDPRAAGLSILK